MESSRKINFSLTQLEYVLAVHKLGHFAKAAEFCQVTQPTLSMQIQKLEEGLGVIIFDRSKKPILLTEVGKKLVEQMRQALMEAKKISDIILADKSAELNGQLTLAVIPTVAPYILPRLLPEIERKFPQLKLVILELQTHQILGALNSDEIDVGLLATPVNTPQIHEFPLYYEPFWVLAGKKHELNKSKKVKYSELKFDDIWLLEEGHCLRNQVLDICSVRGKGKEEKRFQFESGNLETLKNIVNTYGGYTLIPQLANENIGANSTAIPFDRPIPSREIGLVYRREHYRANLIEALGECIIAALPEAVRKLREKDLRVLDIE